MTLKDILAKVVRGEALSNEEKEFCESFDLQSQLDSAAGSARRKAERERDDARAKMQEAIDALEDLRSQTDPNKAKTEMDRLMSRIEKLETAKKAAEDRAAAVERTNKVRQLAKDAGIVAAKGISSKSLDALVDALMGGVDIEDADAVKAAFDSFKADNAGMIAAGTVGGVGHKGVNDNSTFTGENPFSKKTFNLTKQIELKMTNPELAKSLQAAASNE